MHISISVLKISANFFETMPVKLSMLPFVFVVAMIPKSGIAIPVNKNPSVAIGNNLPVLIPIFGGKIKLPAPKNIANNAKPVTITSLIVNFLSIIVKYLQ